MASEGKKFEIVRSRWWKPLLAAFTATEERAYVTVNDKGLVARFGYYRIAIPHEQIEKVEQGSWPWYRGTGWRSNLRSWIGLIGSYDGVVHIVLNPALKTTFLKLPVKLTDFYVSVDDPAGLVAALQAEL